MTNLIPRLEFLFQSFFRRQKTCPHCQSLRIETIAKKYGTIRIHQCKDCHLFFTGPIYRSSLTSNLYDTLYQGSGSVTKVPKLSRLNFWKCENFGSSDRNFSRPLEAIASLCRNGARRLLEIGSSWGYFLYQAKREGFDVMGIEIADKRRVFGIKHLEVPMVRSFSELGRKTFDVIYASHVLEHLPDVSNLFNHFYEHLEPEGKLVIEVPNFDYPQFGHKIKKIIGAVHPLGFSSEFFNFNLPKYGFKILGLFDDWKNFSARPSRITSGASLIVLAEKI